MNRRIRASVSGFPLRSAERDRTQIFELHDIATLQNGNRIAVSDSRGLARAGVKMFHEREAISRRLLEAAIGDEIELLNGKLTTIVAIEKGGAFAGAVSSRRRAVTSDSDHGIRSVTRESSAISRLILRFLKQFGR